MPGTSSRMLALLSLLQARRDWPGLVLAERLDVSPRTVRRDVDRLRELGYRIGASKGPYGGYRLEAGSELPPLLFDDEQAVAVAVALQSVGSYGVHLDEAASRALATVRQVMPARLRTRLDGIRFEVAEQNAARVAPDVLEAVSAATHARQTLRFEYGASALSRHVEPYALVARGARWYLVAWDLDRGEWRIFRLDRLVPRAPTRRGFAPREIPGGDPLTFLAARFKGGDEEDRWPCMGELRIRMAARELATWLRDAEIEDLGDGSCRVVVGSWSWVGLLALVARLDAPFTIVGPAALRAASGQLAARLVAAAATPARP